MSLGTEVHSIGAERIISSTRTVAISVGGRICGEPGCETILSIYNPDKNCALHNSGIHIRTRGAR